MQITPVSRERLVAEITDLIAGRSGRVRAAVDGATPTGPVGLAGEVAVALRARGRAVVEVAAADYLRPASVRLEYGRTDADELLDGWLDDAGLRREVLDPARPAGSGKILPRLWDTSTDRAFRDGYTSLPADGVVLVAGALLLGRGLPFDAVVHLRMSEAALARRLDATEHWTLPAYARYRAERDPEAAADLLVLADHPKRPALGRGRMRGDCGRGGS